MEVFLSNNAVKQYERLYEPLTIEAASEDEAAMIEDGMAEYRANPSSFTPWAKVRRVVT